MLRDGQDMFSRILRPIYDPRHQPVRSKNRRICDCPITRLKIAGLRLHVKANDGTPSANMYLTLLHKLGLDDITVFGDSTGELAL